MTTDKKGGDKERSTHYVHAGANELEFFFVRGMPLIITCKGKIGHESWEVANGRKCIAHSFIHNNRDEFIMPSSAWKKESIGKVINIDQPEIVNVQLISNKKELGEIIPFRRISTKEPMKAYLKHASSTTKNFLQIVCHQYLIMRFNKGLFSPITNYKVLQ